MSDKELEVKEPETVEETANAESMETLLYDPTLPVMTMRKLLDAGVHFGHPTRRWNPKMAPYIYSARNGIHIIDLKKTCDAIINAYAELKKIVDEQGKVLFVGTKNSIREVVQQEALRSGSFYMTNRWLGGTLTNFKTIQSRIRYFKELQEKEANGELAAMNKKEAGKLRKEMVKLNANLAGIVEMRKVPQALVVVDPLTEHNAIVEAKKLGIKVFAIVDTNACPDGIDYVIPGNDDAIRSIALLTAVLADAIVEAKHGTPVVAYTKDEGEEVTMKEVIKSADKENAEKLAKIRAERKARQEKYEKEQAERAKYRAERDAKREAANKEAAEPKADEGDKE